MSDYTKNDAKWLSQCSHNPKPTRPHDFTAAFVLFHNLALQDRIAPEHCAVETMWGLESTETFARMEEIYQRIVARNRPRAQTTKKPINPSTATAVFSHKFGKCFSPPKKRAQDSQKDNHNNMASSGRPYLAGTISEPDSYGKTNHIDAYGTGLLPTGLLEGDDEDEGLVPGNTAHSSPGASTSGVYRDTTIYLGRTRQHHVETQSEIDAKKYDARSRRNMSLSGSARRPPLVATPEFFSVIPPSWGGIWSMKQDEHGRHGVPNSKNVR